MDDNSLPLEEQPNSAGSIVEEHAFTEHLGELRISHGTLYDILSAHVIGIALRSPEVYPRAPGTDIRRIRIEGGVGHPPLNIWIECDREMVKLIDIELVGGSGR